MSINVIYLGNNGKGCDYIHCHLSFNIIAVICQAKMVNEDLLTCCYLRDIPLIEIKGHADLKEALVSQSGKFDFAIMLSFGIIIKKSILELYNIYNLHMSYLPLFKGKNSTYYATMAGEKRIGASLHKVTASIDEGPIISRKLIPYYFWMGENELWENLLKLIPALLDDLLLYLTDGHYKTIGNNADHYTSPVDKATFQINLDTPVNYILNMVRTQEKYNGIKFNFEDTIYIIKKVKVTSFQLTKIEDMTVYKNLIIKKNIPFGVKINEKYLLQFVDISVETDFK